MKDWRGGALLLVAFLGACSSSAQSGRDAGLLADSGAPEPDGGAFDTTGGGDGAGGAGPAACLQSPPSRGDTRSSVTVNVQLTYAGRPVDRGEAFTLPGGGTLTLSNFRFYVSDVELVRQDERTTVDLVAPDGTPAPYNVHLVNAEDSADMTFRIAAPTGDYTGMAFTFGLNAACNSRDPSFSNPPLDVSSQMTWPSPFGFLFLRYEGVVAGDAGLPVPPRAVAMGGLFNMEGKDVGPRVIAPGALAVTGVAGESVRLRVAIDQIFEAASLPLDMPSALTLPPAQEIELGEHLRQNATKVPIFSVVAGP